MTKRRDYLTIGETAERLGLAVDTVRRLETAGELQATRTAGGHRRFRREVVEAFRVRQGTGARRASPPAGPSAPRRAAPSTFRPARPVRAAPPVIDPEDELAEDWDDPDQWQDDDEPPLPPVRRAAPAAARQETPIRPAPGAQESDMQKTEEEQRRLNRIKTAGMNGIPYDVPASWRGKVVEDLNRFVTADRFPNWVPEWEAQRIVRGHVEDVLKPFRDQVAEETARKNAREEGEDKVRALINHGIAHANRETLPASWDSTSTTEARREVEERLKREVKPNWTELRVRDRVDEILAEWEEDGEEDE